MGIIVQKFGGTSVASEKGWRGLCKKVSETLESGNQPVVIVSAMGRRPAPYATDSLLGLLDNLSEAGDGRERDMLMACGEIISSVVVSHYLRSRGLKAKAFDGAEAGIAASGKYGDARIDHIDPQAVNQALREGFVPVIAGFQGLNEKGEIVTLGRGGSDTTAAAMGAALKADRVDIFTDVEGVMTADPRCVPEAKVLDRVSHAEIGEMAHQGAKVLHPRAVEISQAHNVPLRVCSTFSSHHGTDIETLEIADTKLVPARLATGVVSIPGFCMARAEFPQNCEKAELSLRIFEALAKASVSLDMINVNHERVCFIVRREDREAAERVLSALKCRFKVRPDCGKLSVVGQAMRGQPGVMLKICRALAACNTELFYSTDSHITISAVVPEERLNEAAQAVHKEFGLDK